MPPTEISVLFSDKISAKKEPDLETICLAKKKKKNQNSVMIIIFITNN